MSPTLLVKKKNDGWRFCIDYKVLNWAIILNRYPILVVNELLDELYGKLIFSKLDLKSRYYHTKMKKENIPKTTFKTHHDHYEFKVMHRLSNVLVIFQLLINQIFQHQLRQFVLVFFDHILMYNITTVEHLYYMRKIFFHSLGKFSSY